MRNSVFSVIQPQACKAPKQTSLVSVRKHLHREIFLAAFNQAEVLMKLDKITNFKQAVLFT